MVDDWRPIETAPSDGSWHLVRCADYEQPAIARRMAHNSTLFENYWNEFALMSAYAWRPLGALDS